MKGSLAMPYFRTSAPALSSAMKRFTVLFEMGRSGTASLLSPSNSVRTLIHICNQCASIYAKFVVFYCRYFMLKLTIWII